MDEAKLVSLIECPPGPFLFNGDLFFKTEYNWIKGIDIGGGQVRWEMTRWPDAYCMSSGEKFWGGCTDPAETAALLVQPVDLDPADATPYIVPDDE